MSERLKYRIQLEVNSTFVVRRKKNELGAATIWDCRMRFLLVGNGRWATALVHQSSTMGLLLMSHRMNAGNRLISVLIKKSFD